MGETDAKGFDGATFSGTGLACRRGGHGVFAGLAFSLAAGDALVLRGANGSGKSSLLRLMAGLIPPQAGALLWNGAAIDREDHGRRVRFVGHLDAVKPGLTVAENLRFWAHLHGAGDKPAAVSAFALGRLVDLPARVLSAGQRHRLALARLLVAPAPLWLLDEPTNTLDDAAIALLAHAIAAHRRIGGMVVIASHGVVPAAEAKTLDLQQFTAVPAPHWSDAA